MFTKQQKAIAEIIKNNQPQSFQNSYCNGKRDVLQYVTSELADYFETDNVRFDRAKFLDACGIS